MTNSFEAKPKKWGNSLGIVVPANIVKDNNLDLKKAVRVILLPPDNSDILALAGTLGPWPKGKTTQEVLDEIDEEEHRAEQRRYRRHLRNH
jgi:antitoxin component of MazEF toxin-antitoxin module